MQKSHLTFIFLLTFFTKFVAAQGFENEPLPTVFQKAENQTNLIFNYDPKLLSGYSFSGKTDFAQPEIFIKKLLYETPFEFELNGQSVLIFLPEKRDYRICGSIKNKKYGESLALANVFADDKIQGVQADENGIFDFTFSGYKNAKISVSYIGFESQIFLAQEFSDDGCKDIFLNQNLNLFGGEIIVTDYILEGITEGEAYNSVNLDYGKLAKESSTVEHDILKTAQLIPGITSVDESASNLQIRGGTADQNLVLWEGATLYDPGHFFGMISSVNPFVVDEMKIYKGVFDPSYENRVGGVIDMSLTDIPTKKIHGGAGTTLSEGHAFLEVPILKNRASIITSGRHSIGGIYTSPTLGSYAAKVFQGTKIEDSNDDDTGDQILNFYDFNAKILYRPTDNILLKASGISTHNNFNFFAFLSEDDLETADEVLFNSNAFSFSAEADLTPNWQVDLAFRRSDYSNNYYFSIDESDEDSDEEMFLYSSNVLNDILKNSYSVTNHFHLSKNEHNIPQTELNFGYELSTITLNLEIDETFEISEANRGSDFQEANLHNFFGSLNYQKNKISLNGGLRSTFYQEVDFWAFSPRLNFQFALSKELKLKASGGIFHQFISQLNDFGDNELGVNNKVWILSEEETGESQRAGKIAAGFIFRKNGWLVDLEGYLNSTAGLISLPPAFGGSADSLDFFTGESLSRGIDFLVKKRWGDYRILGSYTLSKVDFDFPEASPESFPASHDQRHNLSLLTGYDFKNWNFSLTWQYRSGLPYSIPLGIEMLDNPEDENYRIKYEQLNNERLGFYSRLDLGISYRPKFKKAAIQSEFSFSIINLLDRENFFSRSYFADDPENGSDVPELFFIEKRQLGFMPLVLARVAW